QKQVRPLYGVVFTPQGAFEGFIQWDDQERLTTDLLDGKGHQGTLSLPFGEIQEIRAQGDSAMVTTFSGKAYLLGGGEDVSSDIHDIIVKSLNLGHVRIPWSQFKFARFFEESPDFGPTYDDFALPSTLCASVERINGRPLSGTLVFDLDESQDYETIEGQKEGIFYHIPLRNIKRIERRNYSVCAIMLKNGDQLYLGEEHDLTDQNWGLLLWYGPDRVMYIPWNEVSSVNF
ncbi:MAG: hypothetical protein NWR72_21095, partial [Bacteroidia bacterium]|nr:hypothetical protein [Bacteroidia bacterium]